MSKYVILIKQLSICGFILQRESSIRYFQGIYQSSTVVLWLDKRNKQILVCFSIFQAIPQRHSCYCHVNFQ